MPFKPRGFWGIFLVVIKINNKIFKKVNTNARIYGIIYYVVLCIRSAFNCSVT